MVGHGTATVLFIFLVITAIFSAIMSLMAFRRYQIRGAIPYGGLCMSVALYTLFYALEIVSLTPESAMIWNKIQYIGIATIPSWAILFILQYTGYQFRRPMLTLITIWVLPLLIILARFTDEWHGMVYREVSGTLHQGVLILEITGGFLYWVNVGYINLMLFATVLLLIRHHVNTQRAEERRQVKIMLAGLAAPWLAHVMYQTGLSPLGTDLTPYGFAATGVFLGYALFVHKMFELQPLVRDKIIKGIRDGVLVTDSMHRIIEVNPSMNRHFGSLSQPLIGLDSLMLFRKSSDMVALIKGQTEDIVTTLDTQTGSRTFLVRRSAVTDPAYKHISHIYTFSDITEKTEIELALQEKTTELESYFSNSLDLLCILNKKGIILHLNPVWESLMGYSLKELQGRQILEFVHPSDHERVKIQLGELEQRLNVSGCLARFRTCGGTYKWLEWRLNATEHSLYASIRDVTQKVAEKESLVQLVRFTEEFLQYPIATDDFSALCANFLEISKASVVHLLLHTNDEHKNPQIACSHRKSEPSHEVFTDHQTLKDWESSAVSDDSSSGLLRRLHETDPLLGLLAGKNFSHHDSFPWYSLRIPVGGRSAGEFVFRFSNEQSYPDIHFLALYARQAGLLLARLEAEQAGEAERAYFETLFESSPAGIAILDSKDRVKRANDEFLRMFGYTAEEVSGQQINNLIVPEYLKEEGSSMTETVARGEMIQHKTQRKRKNGDPVDVSILGKPVYTPQGELLVYGIYIDISAQVVTEKALKNRQKELRHALDLQRLISEVALELNVLRDFDERIDRVLRIIGIATEVSRVYIFENDIAHEFSRNVYEWCVADVSAEIDNLQMVPFTQIREIIDTLLQKGQLVSSDIQTMEEETRILLESQNIKAVVMHPLWVNHQFFGFIGYDECRSTRIWNDAELELLRAVSAVIANSYERRHAEREMLEERDRANRANQAKSDFLANMSHEIRTPMNAILGFSETLYERLDEPEYRSMLASVLSSGRSLLSLLNDILDLSKIEAGKLEIIRQPVTVRSLIQDITTLFQDKAARKGLSISIDIPANVPKVINLDEIRVKQVMFNLVGNAVKFTHRGFVRISLMFIPKDGALGDLMIAVKDTGIGIASDQLAEIFDTFSQVSGRSTRPYEGSGLGLAISKRLTEQMNGEILVESVEGIGSVFTMVLRGTGYSNDPLPFADQYTGKQPMPFLKSRVLIIDDVESNVLLVKSILGKLGLDTISAANGPQGIEMAQHAKPNLIIMDLRMPGMDGFHAAEILKADPRTAEIPIIAYTAAVIEFNAHEKSNLFESVLVKPIHKSELIYELSRFIPRNEYPQTEPASYQIAQPSLEQLTNEHNTALARILEKDFLPRWSELNDQLVIYKIEAFGQDLMELARTFDFAYLNNYAQELIQALDVLNLDQIQQLVSFFPEIILALDKRL